MKKFNLLFVMMIGFALFNCAVAGPGYGINPGSLYTNVTLNKDVSSATEAGAKTGDSCAYSLAYAITVGDASIKSAQEDGGIKVVKAVDYQYTNILGIYTSVCTIARGD
ncbi:TRL domain-containing protein [Leptospira meyeri]|uniref:TRL domain-containing protein n=1 Tax=Leptospira meyeri TaxID=29508 RepID=UPI00108460F6|nr:TRL domain-containing protein [Leptospira meyeri]TGL12513.1 TRL-like family protein [Leptospira meyeri]